MKRPLLMSAALVALTTSLVVAEVDLEGVKCIMNPRANAKAEKALDYKGGQVFFCCDNCPKGFTAKLKAGDELVAAKANAQLVATDQAEQSKCPLTGRPINSAQTVDVRGATVAFCCPNCKGKAAGLDGDAQLLLVLSDKAYKKAGFKVKKDDDEK